MAAWARKIGRMAQSRINVAMGPMPGAWPDGGTARPDVSKPAAGYRDAAPGAVNRCSACFHFYPVAAKDDDTERMGGSDEQMKSCGTCDIVEGTISSNGVCEFYTTPQGDSGTVNKDGRF